MGSGYETPGALLGFKVLPVPQELFKTEPAIAGPSAEEMQETYNMSVLSLAGERFP